eukprot:m.349166 g.349166  ORF g.349166 m.349166 type:complete len:72 (-) comp40567_c0_seq1:177-392(-)
MAGFLLNICNAELVALATMVATTTAIQTSQSNLAATAPLPLALVTVHTGLTARNQRHVSMNIQDIAAAASA